MLEGLDTAAQEAVVELDGSSVRFAHPLLGSICYERAPVWKRRAVHEALAGAVADVEEQARHLALAASGPDPVVASYLDAGSEEAAARGAPGAAAELSELAAGLTASNPELARERRFRAARLHRVAGDGEEALAILEQLLADAASGAERSDILYELALSQAEGIRTQVERCDAALAEAGGDDARCARILALRAGNRLLAADVDAALADGRAAVDRAERAGDSTVLAQAIAYAGQAETYHGETTSGLLERGLEIEAEAGLELEWNWSPSFVLGRRLMRLGRDRPRPRDLRGSRGEGGITRGRGQPRDGALVVDRARVARRPLEPRARACRCGV